MTVMSKITIASSLMASSALAFARSDQVPLLNRVEEFRGRVIENVGIRPRDARMTFLLGYLGFGVWDRCLRENGHISRKATSTVAPEHHIHVNPMEAKAYSSSPNFLHKYDLDTSTVGEWYSTHNDSAVDTNATTSGVNESNSSVAESDGDTK